MMFALANSILANRPCLVAWVGAPLRDNAEGDVRIFIVATMLVLLRDIYAVLP